MGRRTFFGLPGSMLKVKPLFNAAAGLIFLVKNHLCQLGEKTHFSGNAFFFLARAVIQIKSLQSAAQNSAKVSPTVNPNVK